MMLRYIDANFVANGLREVLHRPKSAFPDDDGRTIDCLTYAISVLQSAPTADVAPVVHAHKVCKPCGVLDLYVCSNCKGSLNLNNLYCPNCGAKMDEEVNDG